MTARASSEGYFSSKVSTLQVVLQSCPELGPSPHTHSSPAFPGKESTEDYNVACILTLPPYQRRPESC